MCTCGPWGLYQGLLQAARFHRPKHRERFVKGPFSSRAFYLSSCIFGDTWKSFAGIRLTRTDCLPWWEIPDSGKRCPMYGSKQLGGKAWLAVGDFQEIQDKSQSKKKELKGKLILVPHMKILNYQRHWFTLAFKGSLLTTPTGYCQGLWFLTSLWPKDFLSRQQTCDEVGRRYCTSPGWGGLWKD